MSSRIECPAPLAEVIGEEAAQVANALASMLLMGRQPPRRTCSCAEVPSRCQVTAENGRVHVEFDPNQRCQVCGAPPRRGDLSA